MKNIKVTFYYDNDSKSETVEVPIHHSLMEASKYYSKDNYIPGIEADCGGWLPLSFSVALTGLEILVAFLQAYVFAILTCIYLNDALNLHH